MPTSSVREGVLAFRIAAHAGDVARGLPGARAADDAMAEARAAFDWERQFRLALDGRRARARWRRTRSAACAGPDEHCSMCGEDFCALRATRRLREAAAGASRP
jgi:phosphomethylpyrimidine synthase